MLESDSQTDRWTNTQTKLLYQYHTSTLLYWRMIKILLLQSTDTSLQIYGGPLKNSGKHGGYGHYKGSVDKQFKCSDFWSNYIICVGAVSIWMWRKSQCWWAKIQLFQRWQVCGLLSVLCWKQLVTRSSNGAWTRQFLCLCTNNDDVNITHMINHNHIISHSGFL